MPKNGAPPQKNKASRDPEYKLLLFITGATPNSLRAVANIKRICDNHLAGRHTLEIVDAYQQRDKASAFQFVALPMLVKQFPLPERRMIGDFSDEQKVLQILNLL